MMGAAMLKHQFVWPLWASYNVQLVEMCMLESQVHPLCQVYNCITFLSNGSPGFPQGLENLEKWQSIFRSGDHTGKVREFYPKYWKRTEKI